MLTIIPMGIDEIQTNMQTQVTDATTKHATHNTTQLSLYNIQHSEILKKMFSAYTDTTHYSYIVVDFSYNQSIAVSHTKPTHTRTTFPSVFEACSLDELRATVVVATVSRGSTRPRGL